MPEMRDAKVWEPSTFASRKQMAGTPRDKHPMVRTGRTEVRLPGDHSGRGSVVFEADIFEEIGRRGVVLLKRLDTGEVHDITTVVHHDEGVQKLGLIRRTSKTSGPPDGPPVAV